MIQLRRVAILTTASLLSLTAPALAQSPAPATSDEVRPYLVAVSVSNLETSAAWYVDHLGFRLVDKKEFPDYKLRIAILERDRFRLELVQTEGAQSPSRLAPGSDNPARILGFGKLAFLVTDVDARARRMKEKGLKLQLEPTRDDKDGTKSFIVLDPDGNWIQLTQRTGA